MLVCTSFAVAFSVPNRIMGTIAPFGKFADELTVVLITSSPRQADNEARASGADDPAYLVARAGERGSLFHGAIARRETQRAI